MALLASFSYYAPRVAVVVAGGLMLLAVCVFIALKIRSKLAACVIGAVSGGLIAAGVFSTGTGDMTELITTAMAVFGTLLGAVVGGISGAIGHGRKNGTWDKGDGQSKA